MIIQSAPPLSLLALLLLLLLVSAIPESNSFVLSSPPAAQAKTLCFRYHQPSSTTTTTAIYAKKSKGKRQTNATKPFPTGPSPQDIKWVEFVCSHLLVFFDSFFFCRPSLVTRTHAHTFNHSSTPLMHHFTLIPTFYTQNNKNNKQKQPTKRHNNGTTHWCYGWKTIKDYCT